MTPELHDLDPQTNTLPGVCVIGFHGELSPDQTPSHSQPIWIDGDQRMVAPVRPRRRAELPAPPPGRIWLERPSDATIPDHGPLPGVGTRLGPYPARPEWVVASLGPREFKLLPSLKVEDSGHPNVDAFLGWLMMGEPASGPLQCQRDGQLAHWHCSAADELELRRRVCLVAEIALITDARGPSPAQLQKTSFWLARAAVRDEDIFHAAAGLAFHTGERSPRVESLLSMLTHRHQASVIEQRFADAVAWLRHSIASRRQLDGAAAVARARHSAETLRYRESVRNSRKSTPLDEASPTPHRSV